MKMHPRVEPTPPPVPSAFTWLREPWGPLLRCRPLEAAAAHGWTTRSLALAGGRDPCEAEWRQLAATGGAGREAVRLVHQVHGATIADTSEPAADGPPAADGLVSDDAAALLTIRVADCVPLLLLDTRVGAVAAVHGGWRGTAARIAASAVAALVERYHTRTADVVAAVGPSIGPCCYTVGPDLVDAFSAHGHDERDLAKWFDRRDGSLRLDLWAATRDQLAAAGVAPGAVFVSGLCTACHPDWFFSYRREGAAAGRLVGFIRAAGRH